MVIEGTEYASEIKLVPVSRAYNSGTGSLVDMPLIRRYKAKEGSLGVADLNI